MATVKNSKQKKQKKEEDMSPGVQVLIAFFTIILIALIPVIIDGKKYENFINDNIRKDIETVDNILNINNSKNIKINSETIFTENQYFGKGVELKWDLDKYNYFRNNYKEKENIKKYSITSNCDLKRDNYCNVLFQLNQ